MTITKAYLIDNPLYDGLVFQSRDDALAFAEAVRLDHAARLVREVAFLPDSDACLGVMLDLLAGGTDE